MILQTLVQHGGKVPFWMSFVNNAWMFMVIIFGWALVAIVINTR